MANKQTKQPLESSRQPMTAKRKPRSPAIPPTLRRLEKAAMLDYEHDMLATKRLHNACAAHAAYLRRTEK